MNKWFQPSIVIIQAIGVGFGVCLILVGIITLSVPPIIDYLNPIPPRLPPCPYLSEGEAFSEPCDDSGGRYPSNMGELISNAVGEIVYSLFLYLLSIWIGSFVSGLYLNSRRVFNASKTKHSLISAFIIGIVGAYGLFLYLPPSDKQISLATIMTCITLGIIAALIGLGGYFIAGYFHKRKREIVF